MRTFGRIPLIFVPKNLNLHTFEVNSEDFQNIHFIFTPQNAGKLSYLLEFEFFLEFMVS